jgi:hypothetical protein
LKTFVCSVNCIDHALECNSLYVKNQFFKLCFRKRGPWAVDVS